MELSTTTNSADYPLAVTGPNGHLCDARCSVLVHGEILNISRKLLSLPFEETP